MEVWPRILLFMGGGGTEGQIGMFGASDWRKRRGPKENQDLGRWSLFSRGVEVQVDVKIGSSGARASGIMLGGWEACQLCSIGPRPSDVYRDSRNVGMMDCFGCCLFFFFEQSSDGAGRALRRRRKGACCLCQSGAKTGIVAAARGEGKVSCDKSPTKLESTPHLSADVDGLVLGGGRKGTIAPAASSRRCRGELLMTEHQQIMETWP